MLKPVPLVEAGEPRAPHFGEIDARVAHPVLNDCTRVSVEMSPATGTLVVAGWEPDGRGSAARATQVTRFACT